VITVFDIVGDVHGHAERLEALLDTLGYLQHAGAWRHPERTVIFVGDFIDRGPGQLRTLNLVRSMIDAGSAQAVMGNHELNAIGWMTTDPDDDGLYLRPRHGPKGEKNRRQHQAFLSEVGPDSPEHRSWIDWFLELPLWIETSSFRVVHACWSPAAADSLAPWLRNGAKLNIDALPVFYQRSHPACTAVDVLLKGPEVSLPAGSSFTDKDGHERHEIRTRWWAPESRTFREAYIGPDDVEIPDIALPAGEATPAPDRSTFIGHYWLNPNEAARPLSDRVACVDYSVAKGGPLMAYRYSGEATLTAENFVAV
jgi:hypothetical protein